MTVLPGISGERTNLFSNEVSVTWQFTISSFEKGLAPYYLLGMLDKRGPVKTGEQILIPFSKSPEWA